jgi:hypothetical protein
VAGVVILQVLSASIQPLAAVLHVQPLAPIDWIVVAIAGSIPGVAGQVVKTLRERQRERP